MSEVSTKASKTKESNTNSNTQQVCLVYRQLRSEFKPMRAFSSVEEMLKVFPSLAEKEGVFSDCDILGNGLHGVILPLDS